MGWRGRSDDDCSQEILEHIETETRDNIDRGMSPEAARRAARVTFGSVEGTRERLQEGRSGYWISTLAKDFRYGCRMIGRNPRISCLVVLILSLGLGLTTAVFSVVNAYAFRPPVARDPDSYVGFIVKDEDGRNDQVASVSRYETLRRQTQSMRELAAWSVLRLHSTVGSSDAAKVPAMLVSCNFFSVFGEKAPALGRFLQPEDCASPAPVMVISEGLWRERFSEDPTIVGKSVLYGDTPLTVVGVVASPRTTAGTADVWLPYTLANDLKSSMPWSGEVDLLNGTDFNGMAMAGRLQTGYSRASAASEFHVLIAREAENSTTPGPDLELTDGSPWAAAPVEMLWIFSLATALPAVALLAVCATVATLLLSRAVGRKREMAVRLALGGSKARLVRMLLVESLLLTGLAALASLVLVYKVPALLLELLFPGAGTALIASPDWRVFAYQAALTLLTAIGCGLTPALESLSVRLGESLKGRSVFGDYRGPSGLRQLLVGIQVALSMIPLIGAITLIRAEHRVVAPGFETRQVVFAEIPKEIRAGETQFTLTERVRSLPAVRSVAYTASLPAGFEAGALNIEVPGQPPQDILSPVVSPSYFDTLNIPIVSGRSFRETDRKTEGGAQPIIVSQRFASRFFHDQDVIGKTVRTSAGAVFEIIGAARNRSTGRGPSRVANDNALVYRLMEPELKDYLIVRIDGDTNALTPALQSILKESTGRNVQVSTLQSYLHERLKVLYRVRTLLVILGAVIAVLTLIGVFGLLSFTVMQRSKELAIRTALGADKMATFKDTFMWGFRPVPGGILAGLLLSFGALKIVESQGVAPLGLVSQDPLPYIVVTILMLVATLVAMLSPACRATSVEPAKALREE